MPNRSNNIYYYAAASSYQGLGLSFLRNITKERKAYGSKVIFASSKNDTSSISGLAIFLRWSFQEPWMCVICEAMTGQDQGHLLKPASGPLMQTVGGRNPILKKTRAGGRGETILSCNSPLATTMAFSPSQVPFGYRS